MSECLSPLSICICTKCAQCLSMAEESEELELLNVQAIATENKLDQQKLRACNPTSRESEAGDQKAKVRL